MHIPTVDLPGKEVLDKTVFPCTEEGAFKFHWQGYGLRLYLPKETVGSVKKVTVEIVSATKFQLPANTELVSPVFWLEVEGKLDRPARLKLQHWGLVTREEQCTSLSFVMCRATTAVVHQFELCGGSFSSGSNYGQLEVMEFKYYGIIRNLQSDDVVEPSYAAKVFYESDDKLIGTFVVVPWHEMYLTVSIK